MCLEEGGGALQPERPSRRGLGWVEALARHVLGLGSSGAGHVQMLLVTFVPWLTLSES